MSSKEKVFKNVKEDIARFSNYPTTKIKDEHVLVKNPLKMDTQKLNYLALSLRAYVKKHDDKKTVLAKELKKSKLTVLKLCNLINSKINS
jgi:hypothetical protein